MEVKNGWRNTEIGLLPDDWNELQLFNVAKLKARIGWQGLTTAEYKLKGEYFLVTGTEFRDGRIFWEKCFYVDYERYRQDKNIQLKLEDVLVTKDGTIGKVAFVDVLPNEATLNSGVFVLRPIKDGYNPKFFYYLLRSKYFHNFLDRLAAGSTISHLYQKDFIHFRFPLPPTLEEQQAIAIALGDLDELITTLSKLIEKKKKIRHTTIQQFLTGKKRLKGFTADWEKKYLIDLCKKNGLVRGPFGGSLKKDVFVNNGYKVYEQKNAIYKNISLGEYFIDEQKFIELKRFELLPYDFIVSCSGTIGKVYMIPHNAPRGIINQALLKIRINEDVISKEYFYYYFEWDKFQNKIIDNTHGGAMKNLVGMDIFRKTIIKFPKDKKEQAAVARVLNNLDLEIKILEQKRDKYKSIKQGMMQELLTGKTRLV